jgi:diguanylate cyclase (GGDEF)-like protein
MTTRIGLKALAQLNWTRVERALGVLGMLVFTHCWVLGGALYALMRDDRERLIRVPVVQGLLPVLAVFIAGALLLFYLGLLLRRRRPDSLLFQQAAAGYLVLTLVWTGYYSGTLSMPAGAALMGSALAGYLLLERRVVRVAFVLAFLCVFVLNVSAALGLQAYAPALVSPHEGASLLFWSAATLWLSAPYLVVCFTAMAYMLSLWQKRESHVLKLSLTDALTGVHNRRSILAQLEAELARSQAAGRPLAVVLLDLDHFKRINDTWGHPTGDRVLREAARALRACLRPDDVMGRFGGEEFLLLLTGLPREGAAAVVERCRAGLAALVVNADSGERIPVAGSFGIAWCAEPAGLGVEALVQAADARLAAAKQGGRNRVEITELTAPALPAPQPVARVMREASLKPRRLRLLRVLRDFLAGWQKWTPVDQQLFHLGLSIALFGNYIVWAIYLLLREDRETLVNMPLHAPLMIMMMGIVAGYGLLIAIGLLIRRRWPGSRLFQVVSQQYFAVTLITVGHVVGMFSFATGVMLVSMPLVGFLYFERRLVWWSLATALLMVIGLGYASAVGLLTYAPAFAEGVDRYQPHSLFWMLSFYHFTWASMAVMLVLADQTIGRWRQRGEQVVALSRTDTLTQVHNRRSILGLLAREVAKAEAGGAPLTVVLLDIDHFKKINDSWGHPTGDRVLREAARILAASLREGDAVGRYGGEEFMLILPGTTAEGAAALVERCRAQLAATVVTSDSGTNFFVSASFGVADRRGRAAQGKGAKAGDANVASAEALIRAADAALYRAKAAGRNRIEVGAPA